MSTFSKFVLVAIAALGGAAANAQASTDGGAFKAKSVIAAHEAAPTLTPVVHQMGPAHHRHHHHVRHTRAVHHAR